MASSPPDQPPRWGTSPPHPPGRSEIAATGREVHHGREPSGRHQIPETSSTPRTRPSPTTGGTLTHQANQSTPTGNPPPNTKLSRVGIIGVGTIAEALTIALCAFSDQRAEILLSPRNQVIATRLALRFPNVKVAAGNQAVADASDILILAVRPQVAEQVLEPLRFRPDHQIVSLIATFSLNQLSPLVAPATGISRAVPLPPVAERQGPLTLYTHSPAIVRLLDGLGTLVHVHDEAHLDLISAVTSVMGTYFGFTGAVDRWLTDRGFNPEASRTFTAELFFNLALAARKRPEDSFTTLSADYSTPGGLNEHAWRELQAAGWPDQVQAALNLILDRIHGRATLATKLPPSQASPENLISEE